MKIDISKTKPETQRREKMIRKDFFFDVGKPPLFDMLVHPHKGGVTVQEVSHLLRLNSDELWPALVTNGGRVKLSLMHVDQDHMLMEIARSTGVFWWTFTPSSPVVALADSEPLVRKLVSDLGDDHPVELIGVPEDVERLVGVRYTAFCVLTEEKNEEVSLTI